MTLPTQQVNCIGRKPFIRLPTPSPRLDREKDLRRLRPARRSCEALRLLHHRGPPFHWLLSSGRLRALKHHGTTGYRLAIEHDIDLAGRLAGALRTEADFEVFEPQGLSIVCFRFLPKELCRDEAALDALNKSLLERMQLEGKAFLSSTVMDGKFWLRACIVNPRTSAEDILALIECSRAAGLASMKIHPHSHG